jgi:hypothetical protein
MLHNGQGAIRARISRRKVMGRLGKRITPFALTLIALFSLVGNVEAQRINTREVRDITRSLDFKIEDFQSRLSYQLESSSAGRQRSNSVLTDVRLLQLRVRGFDQDVAARRDNRDSMNDILDIASNVDSFMRANRQYRGLENDWSAIRTQLDRLAANYGITRNWVTNAARDDDRYSTPGRRDDDDRYSTPDVQPVAVSSSPLTGTFQLDTARSERIADVLSGSRVGAAQRQELESKLAAPEEIALDVNGSQVTLASSKASPVTFAADGSERTENSGGRTVRVRSTMTGDKLTVTSIGGQTDYTITFEPQDGGRTLKVTRRITTDYLRETVFAESVYTRTSATAGLGIRSSSDNSGGYSSNDPNDLPTRNPQPQTYPGNNVPVRQRIGEFIVPNGTVLVGTLDTEIDTKVSQNNDRFRMIVQSPNEFRGAVVEGHLSGIDRSGRVLGRTMVTFNFDKITVEGRDYDFAGQLQRLVDHYGKIIPVDNEGTARGKDKNRDTATRGGIGAGIGAIIGAIAGGGSGAAVGAMIGGSVGAGSVYAEGGGDMRLSKGATMTVQSSSPIR